MAVYGYARVSTKKQKLQRQIDNIKAFNESAIIFDEKYTGTKMYGREELEKLLRKVKGGDTIIFDSVSRMSRNADEGIKLYFELMDKGVTLIFLKERYIDTDTYKQAIERRIQTIGTKEDILINAINEYLKELAKEQIKIAFEQSEKEVADLRQRVKEGIAKSDKQQGIEQGTKLVTKKSVEAKQQIKKYSKEFNGTLNDVECMQMTNLSRNTYYKYKRELKAEMML
jgi:DNA invertase Pin-like site-specific DNA recombinase